ARLSHVADGRWAGTVTFHRGIRPGLWSVGVATEFGPTWNGELQSWSSTELARRHLPAHVAVRSERDRTPPVVDRVTLAPHSLDATTEPKTLLITATAHDPGSGVRRISIELENRKSHDAFAGIAGAILTRHGDTWSARVT